ncbi:UvrD-helicase domain-containing protein, partial [Methanosarcina sp.]|uniref:UvrD-helicase domain-containing protein n=1 Tax=Methanosarcina sp. TaxID=2213 RepID=UPI002AB9F019
MVLGNRNENFPDFKKGKLRSFILSIISSITRSFKRIYEICTTEIMEVRNKILKIEKGTISEEIIGNIEKDISELYLKNELYNKRKETYLTYHERKDLIYTCEKCLTTCSSFKNRSKLFDETSNYFVKKSIKELSYLSSEFEGYNNEEFVQQRIQMYDYLFQKSSFPLDNSQKRAIVTDDTHNLVVAGAGSGKTEVLITRTAYLTERTPDKVDAKKILILAYQNKAAEEVKKRLKERFGIEEAEVRTFHSLGKKILEEGSRISGKEIPKLKFSGFNFDKEFSNYVDQLFNHRKINGDFQRKIVDYMRLYNDNEIIKSHEDFEKKEEFYKYMANLTYTALDGTEVRSEAERAILNFFISHNLNGERIKILYEDPAKWMAYNDSNGKKKTPKPDFFFPDYDIYLELWAIDKNGKVPDWFEGKNASEEYKLGMKRKKEKFAQQDKYSLVEISSYEFKGEKFERILIERMTKALKIKYPNKDFEFNPVPYDQLIIRVNYGCKESLRGLSFRDFLLFSGLHIFSINHA